MKKLILILILGSVFFLALAKKSNIVENNKIFPFIKYSTKIEGNQRIIVKDTIFYNIKHKFDVSDYWHSETIKSPGKIFTVYDCAEPIKLFSPVVKEFKLFLWTNNLDVEAKLVSLKRFGWECLIVYIASLLNGFLLAVWIWNIYEKERRLYSFSIFLKFLLVPIFIIMSAQGIIVPSFIILILILAIADAQSTSLSLADIINNKEIVMAVICLYIFSAITTYFIMKFFRKVGKK
ncbi:hypothetical protein K8R66_01730 [bacterium]|nr:hypothetical protein [bacterium]